MGEYTIPELDSDVLLSSMHTYALRRSQSDGEADLREMCQYIHFEDAWLFIPSQNTWLHPEITHKERNEVHTKDIPLTVPHVDYHIHPNSIARESYKKFMERGKQSDEMKKAYSIACQASVLAPSKADLSHYLQAEYMTEGRIVTKIGTVVIQITDRSFNPDRIRTPEVDDLFYKITESETRTQQIIYDDNFEPYFQDIVALTADLYKDFATISFEPAP